MTEHHLTDFDLQLFGEGRHERIYEKLGAHPTVEHGASGVRFSVWAPNAGHVSVVGDWNEWDPAADPLHREDHGIWTVFIAGRTRGDAYKYAITDATGRRVLKGDPYALAAESRRGTASIVWGLNGYEWGDDEWMREQERRNGLDSPMSIYEVHLGSWRRVPEEGNRWLTYRELADRLPDYVNEMGFTHVEFLPVAEHPLDESWGYQVTSYYAPTSRYGTPDDFRHLVDRLHQAGIGVIVDWVPAHFPRDEHGLRRFDGTALYEHLDPRQGEHPDWGTQIFNFGRPEVRNFLVANALFWIDEYHIDGLRVDAVASMLYLDYSRQAGEWIPNEYGGRENLEAIAFLREANERLSARHPGAFTVAEESTAWPGVSRPTHAGGLGFRFKWNMGWMHDTLGFMSRDPIHRGYHFDEITFSMLYAFHEHFVLPLSHDEVVHEKGSIVGKMPGDEWQKFANARLLYGYMYGHPGKKLLFMGDELGPWSEWNATGSLEWYLLDYEYHGGMQRWLRDLNQLYRSEPALYELDYDPHGFAWVDCSDRDNVVIAFIRRDGSGGPPLLFVCNLTPLVRHNYRIGVPGAGRWTEILNSDAREYGGSGAGNMGSVRTSPLPRHGYDQSVSLTLPPLATIVLRPETDSDE